MVNQKIQLYPLVLEFCTNYNIDLHFLESLVELESSWNPYAVRYEPNYLWTYSIREMAATVGCTKETMEISQKMSFGLMQIMLPNAYSVGFLGWPGELYRPEVNLKYGCQFLNRLMHSQGLSFDRPLDVYAAYNAGSVRMSSKDFYVNQVAVSAFKRIYG